ncbi:MAG: DUF6625 family protein [Pseudomonadota bacterium]
MSCIMYAPWFGPLPWYANYFIESCGKSSRIQWIINSDQPAPGQLPANVLWLRTYDLTLRIAELFGVPLHDREWGHKLCDLKPFWHQLFKPFDAPNFEFRGWCDWDVVHDLNGLNFDFDSAKFTNGWQCSPLFITRNKGALEWWPTRLNDFLGDQESWAWDELRYLKHINSTILQPGLTPEVDLVAPARYAVHMYRAKYLPALYEEWLSKYCKFLFS